MISAWRFNLLLSESGLSGWRPEECGRFPLVLNSLNIPQRLIPSSECLSYFFCRDCLDAVFQPNDNNDHFWMPSASPISLDLREIIAQETQERWVRTLGGEDPGKEMATHFSVIAWRTPWIEEPGGLQSMGLQRVRHNWSNSAWIHTHTHTHARTYTSIIQSAFMPD